MVSSTADLLRKKKKAAAFVGGHETEQQMDIEEVLDPAPVIPWDNLALKKQYDTKTGTRTNVRVPEWHYEMAKWLAANDVKTANNTHGVMIQAMAIGLQELIGENR